MAQALAIDRELVKQLFINGLPPSEICRRTSVKPSTLSNWIARGKWREELPTDKPPEDVAMRHVADALSTTTHKVAQRIVCKIDSLRVESLNDCKTAASALAAAYATGRKALGLDDDKQGPRSVIAIFQGAVPPALVVQGDQRAVQASVGPVIDVSEAPSSDTQSEGEGATPNNDGHSESVQDSQSSLQSNDPLEGEQSSG